VSITSLGRGAGHERRAVQTVHLLGLAKPLKFQQTDAALVIDSPPRLSSSHASAFKISFGA
jgi:alpha-L-fucosidase